MSAWSDENVDKLKSLWNEGNSASIIAGQLGGNYSRSAVLGKIHRLEINSGRRQPTIRLECEQPSRKRAEPAAHKPPSMPVIPKQSSSVSLVPARPRRPPPPPIVLEAPVPTGMVTIMELSDKTCKWPIGEPGADDFHFCGVAKASDAPTPYCPYHAQKAVAPVQPKRFSASAFTNGSGRLANVG